MRTVHLRAQKPDNRRSWILSKLTRLIAKLMLDIGQRRRSIKYLYLHHRQEVYSRVLHDPFSRLVLNWYLIGTYLVLCKHRLSLRLVRASCQLLRLLTPDGGPNREWTNNVVKRPYGHPNLTAKSASDGVVNLICTTILLDIQYGKEQSIDPRTGGRSEWLLSALSHRLHSAMKNTHTTSSSHMLYVRLCDARILSLQNLGKPNAPAHLHNLLPSSLSISRFRFADLS